MFERFVLQGKRRRNRSNVEAMAAKHNNPTEQQIEPELTNGRRMLIFKDDHDHDDKKVVDDNLWQRQKLR